MLGDLDHRSESLAVVAHVAVGHHGLDGRDAVPDHVADLLDDVVRELLGENGSEPVVDGHASGELVLPGGDRVVQGGRWLLEREVEHGRVPAQERRVRELRALRCEEVLEVERVVHVRVDATGTHEAAGGVNDLPGLSAQRAGRTDGDDPLALDRNVERLLGRRAHDRPVAHQQVVHALSHPGVADCVPADRRSRGRILGARSESRRRASAGR